jgi:hypothetical protein
MRRSIVPLLPLALGACTPAYVEAFAPKDGSFEVRPTDGCGDDGRRPSLAVEVKAGGAVARRLTVCCGQRDALLERLVGMRDAACEGTTLPTTTVGNLQVGTTVSEISGKPAITLDQGEGYVAFQCEGWLPRLIDELGRASCAPASGALSEAVPPAAAPPQAASSGAPTSPVPAAPATEPAPGG